MKKNQLFTLVVTMLFAVSTMAQYKPAIGFEELMISAEKDFNQVIEARRLAETLDLPHTIYLPEGVFIEAKGIEDNKVVYSVINDLLHPFNGGEVAFWEEINARFDLSEARVHWSNKPTQNPRLGYSFSTMESMAASFIIGPESTTDAVMSFNYNNGTLISAAYIPGGNPNLSTPIEALLTPSATILVSDQLTDKIVEFDTLGPFIRVFYGVNTAILDNCRGIEIRPGVNTVIATVASGANQHACPEFDLATGNYLGNFIAPNATQMQSPWDIIFRSSDCLVSGQGSNNIVRYSLSGNYLGVFVPSINFPEQIFETSSGNILAAGFSGSSGLYIYSSTGALINYFSTISGMRGCIQLGNGNYLVTNASGVYVLHQNTGALLATPISGVSARSLREYDLSIIPVELTSFTANIVDRSVVLNWTTATEVNNQGFEILRSAQNENDWLKIGYVPGFGTTTEPKNYSYTDQSVKNGTYYYRLKQVDFDGSFAYSGVVEVEVSLPTVFSLEQNYPNPFNPNTKISWQSPVGSWQTLKVYDILGNEVATLVDEYKPAGSYEVEFNSSSGIRNLASGIYFYQLDAAGNDGKTFSSVKKMTLLK